MADGTNQLPEHLAEALRRGATILTGNQRAAHALRRKLTPEPLFAKPPVILTWTAWTSSLWHKALLSGATDRVLLNRTQEQALWRALIAREPEVSTLRTPHSLAQLAAAAWRTVAEHDGLKRLAGSATNRDTEAFLRLAAAFHDLCRRSGYLPEARLESALRPIIAARALIFEDTEIVLTGFDRLVPAQQALLDAVRNTGTLVDLLAPPTTFPPCTLLAAEHEPAELRLVAEQCRAFLHDHPQARAALILPDLDKSPAAAAQIDRVLREILAPAAHPLAAAASNLPYELSCGTPLAEHPLIAGALDLLAWATGPLPLDRMATLLLSPSLSGSGELCARAEFDAFELRRAHLLRPELSLEAFLTRLSRSPRRGRLTMLLAGASDLRSAIHRHLPAGAQRLWSEWAEAMRDLLRAATWATEAPIDRAELETRRAWDSALDELATLDFDSSRPTFDHALMTLRGIAADTILPPPFRDAPVQVLTPAESAGLSFDAVWFLRAGDLTWPTRPTLNPLLGWPLARELNLPGANPSADQAHARRVTQRISASAPHVVCSYAHETADGLQRPSPALAGLTLIPSEAPSDPPPFQPLIHLEAVPDDSPIPPPPPGPIPGGIAVLKDQAACAFRAFAERRLFATPLEPRDPGMNARERGVAVHHVLERFWETVQTQANLLQMSPEKRDRTLRETIESALSSASAAASTPWDAAYLDTQRRRLLRLGHRWLDIEAARNIPFTVAQRERESRDVAIGPLHLTLRVDRIDHTEHGAVLIDYKTGNVSHNDWLGERPDEPQLPLYAVLAGEPRLHAIAFGVVRPGENMAFIGFSNAAGTLPKPAKLPTATLDQQIDAWEQVLTQLATGFFHGDTRVSPKDYPATCEYCAQRLLCRLDPTSLTTVEPEDQPEEPLDPTEVPLLG